MLKKAWETEGAAGSIRLAEPTPGDVPQFLKLFAASARIPHWSFALFRARNRQSSKCIEHTGRNTRGKGLRCVESPARYQNDPLVLDQRNQLVPIHLRGYRAQQ
jgi:hypothetical protein